MLCNTCNLEFKSQLQFKQHVDGKKHKKLESIKQNRYDSAERSVFVSGLRKDVLEKDLIDYFTGFGSILKCVVDQEKNSFAIIEFETKDAAEKTLDESILHKINNRTIKVKRRENKEFVAKKTTSTDKKKELLEKLKEEALAVNSMLVKCQSFDDQIDKLTDYFRMEDKELKLKEEVCLKLNNLFKKYWPNDDCKVEIFGSALTGLACKGSDLDMTLLIRDYLLQNESSTSKHDDLASTKSDKMIMDNSKEQQSDQTNTSDELSEDDYEEVSDEMMNVEGSNSKSNNKILKENLNEFFHDKQYKKIVKFDIENQIKILAQLLQKEYNEIKKLYTITHTRCPLVRFVHDKLLVNCDLSLNNYLACENTRLLKLYLDLEPNMKKLVFVLRYWMKQKKLLSSKRFNTYTIIWLLIFMMQSKKIGFLPTLEQLNSLKGESKLIDNWDVSFESDLNKIKQSIKFDYAKEYSLNDLLKSFFEFYSDPKLFVLGNNANMNKSTPVILVTRNANLVIEDIELTQISRKPAFMYLQDPFNLAHNLTGNISKNSINRFIVECKASNNLLTYSSPLRKSETKCWGLVLLTTRKALPIMTSSSVTKLALTTTIASDSSSLSPAAAAAASAANSRDIKEVIEFVVYLLKECLLIQLMTKEQRNQKRQKTFGQLCDRVDSMDLESSPTKRFKLSIDDNCGYENLELKDNNNNKNDLHDNETKNKKEGVVVLLESYEMLAKENTWQGRRLAKRELKSKNLIDENQMESEWTISKHLIESSKKSDVTTQETTTTTMSEEEEIHFSIGFHHQNTSSSSSSPSLSLSASSSLSIRFDLIDGGCPQQFTTFVHFLDIYINNCYAKYYDQWLKTIKKKAII